MLDIENLNERLRSIKPKFDEFADNMAKELERGLRNPMIVFLETLDLDDLDDNLLMAAALVGRSIDRYVNYSIECRMAARATILSILNKVGIGEVTIGDKESSDLLDTRSISITRNDDSTTFKIISNGEELAAMVTDANGS